MKTIKMIDKLRMDIFALECERAAADGLHWVSMTAEARAKLEAKIGDLYDQIDCLEEACL